ncbi:MAG: sigma 54-interacting transcriptional regulator [Clostridia bacterium]|nr:sigma 54-interacting transcriptional regulator [Clostridia bacterium]
MQLITTCDDKCRQCYACVRACPVKALELQDGVVRVISGECIGCGNCVRVCHSGAKQIADDSAMAENLICRGHTAAIVAPGFAGAFPTVDPERIIGAMRKLGFASVWEAALGGELILPAYREWIGAAGRRSDVVISSVCPAAVALIELHRPELAKSLAPVVSPMTATSRAARAAGEERVVFIGPCPAAKLELSESGVNGSPDVALLYSDLSHMFEKNGIDPEQCKPSAPDVMARGPGRELDFPQGLIRALGLIESQAPPGIIAAAGRDACLEALDAIAANRLGGAVVHLSFCVSCMEGAGYPSACSTWERREAVSRYVASVRETSYRSEAVFSKHIVVARDFAPLALDGKPPSESDIRAALVSMGRLTSADELDCGACGYSSCREKACAVAMGRADAGACLPHLIRARAERPEATAGKGQHGCEVALGGGVPVGTSGFEAGADALDMVAYSPAMEQILALIHKISNVNSTVLITGESGVGKEVVARYIHRTGNRANGPFVKINCGAIPEALLESELFGYEEGAFTGARKEGKPGLIELASGGTVLLDEISEMPMGLQVKLLQALQDRRFVRVGGTKQVKVDARVMAATNRDLERAVREGLFRNDLYYRLNVIPIHIPPLRDRVGDIAPLVYHFLEKYNAKHGRERELSREAREALERYAWPGNVRELENAIEFLVVTVDQRVVGIGNLPEQIRSGFCVEDIGVKISKVVPLRTAVEEVERQLVERASESCRSTYSMARALGVNQSTVVRKMQKYLKHDAPDRG